MSLHVSDSKEGSFLKFNECSILGFGIVGFVNHPFVLDLFVPSFSLLEVCDVLQEKGSIHNYLYCS